MQAAGAGSGAIPHLPLQQPHKEAKAPKQSRGPRDSMRMAGKERKDIKAVADSARLFVPADEEKDLRYHLPVYLLPDGVDKQRTYQHSRVKHLCNLVCRTPPRSTLPARPLPTVQNKADGMLGTAGGAVTSFGGLHEVRKRDGFPFAWLHAHRQKLPLLVML